MGFESNVFNVSNRALSNMDDLVVGELDRTPAVIPSKSLGANAVIVEAAPAGGASSAGPYEQLRQAIGGEPACDPVVAKYEAELQQYEATKAHNAKIDAAIAEAEKEARYLRALISHVDAKGDGVLTFEELRNLSLNSQLPEVREAANWLLGHREVYESLPRKWTLVGGDTNLAATGFDDGCGIDAMAATMNLAALSRKIEGLQSQRRPELPRPTDPTAQATAQPASGSSVAGSGAGAAVTGVMAASGSGSVSNPWATSTETAASIEDAMGRLSDTMAGLEAELAKATDDFNSSDPKVSAAAEKRMNELSRKLQKLTSIMTMLNATLSNIAKVYSEMAMTSVRNMK